MSKLTLTQAVSMIPVSESTLRRDLKSGKVSFETDAKGRKQIDVSELTRVYGSLNTPETAEQDAEPVNETPENNQMNGTDTPNVVALLQNQVTDLKAQLEKADARETALIDEKSKLLDLTDRLQKHNEALMLPPPREKHEWRERLKSIFTRIRKVAPDAK